MLLTDVGILGAETCDFAVKTCSVGLGGGRSLAEMIALELEILQVLCIYVLLAYQGPVVTFKSCTMSVAYLEVGKTWFD